MDKIETVVADVKADATKIATDAKTAQADLSSAKSWLSKNWQYAVAFMVGGLFLGLSIGLKIGAHLHG
jgi:hypothetical protein